MDADLQEILDMDTQIKCLKALRDKKAQAYAEKICPHKVGDIVTCNGFSHEGKQMRIKGIGFHHSWGKGYTWKAIGPVLKKDGSEGLHEGERFLDHSLKFK